MESEHITADCIEATEFPDLVTHYRVQAVPKTVINEEHSLEGALPESYFLDTIMGAVQPPDVGAKA
jgi:predicted DsbA family dithiol-disulfide isomerase